MLVCLFARVFRCVCVHMLMDDRKMWKSAIFSSQIPFFLVAFVQRVTFVFLFSRREWRFDLLMASISLFLLIRCWSSTRIRVCLVPLVCYSMREKDEPILGDVNLYKDISFCFSAISSSCVTCFFHEILPCQYLLKKKKAALLDLSTSHKGGQHGP